MSQPPLNSATIGMNTINVKTSQLESAHNRTKTPEHTPLTLPTESLKQKLKVNVPDDPESDPPSSNSSLSESDSFNERKYIKSRSKNEYELADNSKYSKSKRNKRDKNKKNQKHMRQDSHDLSSSNSNLFDKSEYIHKILNKKKSYLKKDSIKLCANLTETLLTTVYKSNIIKFKLYDDPLHRRIYFINFVESLKMIFS